MADNEQRAAKLNSDRERADTFPWQVTYTEGKAKDPLNLTGWTAITLTVVTIADPPDATTMLFQITGVVTDAANGVVEFEPSPAQADQEPDTYFQDVQGINPAGKVRTLSKGTWIVRQDRNKDVP